MLIHKDLQGDSGLPEHAALGGMLRVGNEFMTERNADSEVQRAGEFVTMKRTSGGFPRMCTIHETPDAWVPVSKTSVSPLDDENYLASDATTVFVQRTCLFVASVSESGEELDFASVPGMKTESRMPRFTYISYTSAPNPEGHAHDRVNDADYATQAGKRRLFALGDGRVLLVRELAKQNDDRWYMGVAAGMSTFSRRRKRTARVELAPINPETGAAGKALMGFDIHSGLGFDPYEGAPNHPFNDDKPYRPSYVINGFPPPALPFYEGESIYMSMTGTMWGRIAIDGVAGDPGIQADASDTYAVAEPAYAPKGTGTYLALVAVHPAPGDTYDPASAGPYRLTCTRTTPEGDVAQTKIVFPTIAGAPNHYYGATGMELVRTSPTTVVLIAHVHAMQSAHPGTIAPAARSRLFFWSDNNGETWTYAQVSTTAPAFPMFPYSSHLVKDADTLLVFSSEDAYSTVPAPDRVGIQVHAVTRAGTSYVTTIPSSRFNEGLRTPYITGGEHDYNTPYIGFGYGGAVTVRGKRRLWMQFDPRWISYDRSKMLQSPPSRPMLMTSDDGGVTWQRRFLPAVWQHHAGFVTAIDSKTLAMPVFSPRVVSDTGNIRPAKARVYISKDGGEKWRPTTWRLGLPIIAWVDGALMPGRIDGSAALAPGPSEYDIDESVEDYNRGELFPLVALHDENGGLSPINPARPWIADARAKDPNG